MSHQPVKATSDSVRIVLRDRDDQRRFLVLSEVDDPDNYKLPGGKLESGETPIAATVRELIEEVGLSIHSSDIGEPIELINDDGVSRRFISDIVVDVRQINPTGEIARIVWVTDSEIPEGKNKNHILAAVRAGMING